MIEINFYRLKISVLAIILSSCSTKVPFKPNNEFNHYLCLITDYKTGKEYKAFIELGTAYRISITEKKLLKKSGLVHINVNSENFELYKSAQLTTDSIPNIDIGKAIDLYLNDQQALTRPKSRMEMDMAMLYFYERNCMLISDCETGVTLIHGRKVNNYLKSKKK